MSRTLRYLLPVLLIAGLIAGCGGGSKVKESNTYVDAVNKAQNSFAATVDQLSSKITPTSTPAEDKVTLAGFQTAVGKVVGDLKAIEPPDRVKTLHAQLISAISDFGEEVAAVGTSMSSKDPTKVIEGQQRLAKAAVDITTRINTTINSINTELNK